MKKEYEDKFWDSQFWTGRDQFGYTCSWVYDVELIIMLLAVISFFVAVGIGLVGLQEGMT